MKNLTYRQIADLIAQLPEDRKDDNASIHLIDTDEYLPVCNSFIVQPDEDDILDEGHLVLEIDF